MEGVCFEDMVTSRIMAIIASGSLALLYCVVFQGMVIIKWL
jgi:hypothetical protein